MASAATESPVTLDEYRAMDMARRREVWLEISDITEAQFDAHMAQRKARESAVPRVGSMAPDFVADRLHPHRPPARRRGGAPGPPGAGRGAAALGLPGKAGRDRLRLVHLTPLPRQGRAP